MITDVGSVKLTPRDNLEEAVRRVGAMYIGSHPMAGSEQAGVMAAQANLFEGAACVITNDFGCSEKNLNCLKSFWESIGCRCYVTSSEEHDRAMARISHLPHMLASVGALVGLKNSEDGKFAGKGDQGTQALQGNQGIQALQGLQGAQHLQGNQGRQGLQGNQGRQGTQGLSNQGAQGNQGRQGLQGNQGTQGLSHQGAQGNQGRQGLQGDDGAQGNEGANSVGLAILAWLTPA